MLSAKKSIVQLKSNSLCLYTGTRRVLKAAPVNCLDETHWQTQIPRGKLHQHKLQPRLRAPSKGFGCFSAEVCAATVLAISAVLQVR